MTKLLVQGHVRPHSLLIVAAAINEAHEQQIEAPVVITSANDSGHMRGSKHYDGAAVDFRTKNMTAPVKHAWAEGLRLRLGNDYDVILEAEGQPNEHLHVELDP